MKIHLGDNVIIKTGKYRGKTGKVIRVDKKINKIVVDNVNMRTKHIKKQPGVPGQKITYPAPFDASNVMILSPESNKPSRVGYVKLADGKKQRILKKFPSESLTTDRDIKKTKKR